jgi:hypothetical protein
MIPLRRRAEVCLEVLKYQLVFITLACGRDYSIIQNFDEVVFPSRVFHNLEVPHVGVTLLDPGHP